jgi:hypothetical protein
MHLCVGFGGAARLAICDDVGRLVRAENIPAGEAPDTQVAAPDKPGFYKAEIARRLAKSEFNVLVLGEVPAHPSVLLTRERLEQLRLQSYTNELLAIVHGRASELRSSIAYNPEAGRYHSGSLRGDVARL